MTGPNGGQSVWCVTDAVCRSECAHRQFESRRQALSAKVWLIRDSRVSCFAGGYCYSVQHNILLSFCSLMPKLAVPALLCRTYMHVITARELFLCYINGRKKNRQTSSFHIIVSRLSLAHIQLFRSDNLGVICKWADFTYCLPSFQVACLLKFLDFSTLNLLQS